MSGMVNEEVRERGEKERNETIESFAELTL
jgi:hypothetical protein